MLLSRSYPDQTWKNNIKYSVILRKKIELPGDFIIFPGLNANLKKQVKQSLNVMTI